MSNPTLANAGRMLSKLVPHSTSTTLTSSRRIEIDITPLDTQVIDDNGDVGRPFLTAAIDAETRRIVGSVVSGRSPSVETMCQCISMGLSSHRRAHTRSTR